MARHQWRTTEEQVNQAKWHVNGSALLRWAMECVDTLHYLNDLEAERPLVAQNHSAAIVALAHARAACGAAITSVDLCAAALGREAELTGTCAAIARELDLGDFAASSRKGSKNLSAVSASGSSWLADTVSHESYGLLREFRDRFIHRRTPRIHSPGGETAEEREVRFALHLPHSDDPALSPTRDFMTARQLVELARQFATERVEAFARLVVSGQL